MKKWKIELEVDFEDSFELEYGDVATCVDKKDVIETLLIDSEDFVHSCIKVRVKNIEQVADDIVKELDYVWDAWGV